MRFARPYTFHQASTPSSIFISISTILPRLVTWRRTNIISKCYYICISREDPASFHYTPFFCYSFFSANSTMQRGASILYTLHHTTFCFLAYELLRHELHDISYTHSFIRLIFCRGDLASKSTGLALAGTGTGTGTEGLALMEGVGLAVFRKMDMRP